MTNNGPSTKGKSGKRKKSPEVDNQVDIRLDIQVSAEVQPQINTEVILIVKGAGEQAEDDHLSLFLRGFWPAVKSLDKSATITQVTKGLEGYQPSPHNLEGQAHKHMTEITASHQGQKSRIWLKEAYWENEVLASSALGNLGKEWRMASFVFVNMLRNVVFTRNTKKLKEQRLRGQDPSFSPGSTPGTRWQDHMGAYLSFVLLFVLVFLPFIVASSSNPWFNRILQDFSLNSGWTRLLLITGVGLLWAIAPTFEHSSAILLYRKEGVLNSLPALPGWVLVVLIFLLVIQPFEYLRFVALLLILQLSLIIARSLLWKQRTYANSDVDIAEYYSYHEQGEKRIGMVDEHFLTRLPFSPLIYRYLVFLTLPIGFAGTILARVLKWTRILGGLGEAIDGVLNGLLVGYMDDVVNYAMDPAQAHRVRSAVLNDIVYFCEKPEVKRIHIVAHSQGTPITYETLFQFLDEKYQEKVYTYATIGSVLSYYNQARGILDPVYYERFPVSRSNKQNFPQEFKWMNFWNLFDPITEFYGLDEYSGFDEAPMLDKDFVRTRTSPTNIRTASSVLENHGEYWNNIEKFSLPLAKRVLGEMRPAEWKPEVIRKEELSRTKPWDWAHYRHHIYVCGLWLLILVGGALTIYGLATSRVLDPLAQYFSALNDSARAVYQSFVPQQPNGQGFTLLSGLWSQILDGLLAILVVWIVVDWVGQFRRILDLRSEISDESVSPLGSGENVEMLDGK